MAEKLQITIVGLGIVGASAGLALRRHGDKVLVVGHDKTPALAAQAKAKGAVDRTDWNLIHAVSNADRILPALPINEIRDTLEAIAQDLKPGCVILDTADAKQQVLEWAAELLPDNVYLVGGHPILVLEDTDAEHARADLFEGKLFCLTPDLRVSSQAIRLAADLAEALGARPFFMDAVEHDGMVAAVEHLPRLMAAALLEATSRSASWQDMRKLAGSQYYTSTLVTAEDGRAAISACGATREHTVRWLDTLIAELSRWRDRLAAAEDEALVEAFEHGLEAGRKWLHAQATGNWDEPLTTMEMPTSGAFMRSLIGFGRLGRPQEKKRR